MCERFVEVQNVTSANKHLVITNWEHLVFKVRLSVDMEMHSHSFFMSQQHSPGLFRIFFVTASAKVSAGAFTHIHKAYL